MLATAFYVSILSFLNFGHIFHPYSAFISDNDITVFSINLLLLSQSLNVLIAHLLEIVLYAYKINRFYTDCHVGIVEQYWEID